MTTTTAPVKILVTTLKDGPTVTAKQESWGNDVFAISYQSPNQAEKAASKLRERGVQCEVIAGRSWRTFYVSPTAGTYTPAEPRGEADTGSGGVHVKVYSGSVSACVTDMTNAGKRGKFCRVLHVEGWAALASHVSDPALVTAQRHSRDLMRLIETFDRTQPFGMLRDMVTDLIDKARADGVAEHMLSARDTQTRGVDAPVAPLTAGVEGEWCGGADENGVHLADLRDINQWQEITHHTQANSEAYRLAAKVWPRVKAARTLQEAATVLRAAGCRLHGYCGMD